MQGGVPAHRAARAHQPRPTRSPRSPASRCAVLQPPVRHALPLRDADQPVRPGRQLRPADEPRAAGADPQVPRGEGSADERRSRCGAPARRGASSSTATTWPTPASTSIERSAEVRARARRRDGAARQRRLRRGPDDRASWPRRCARQSEPRRDRVGPHQARRHAAEAARHRARALFGLAAAHRAGGRLAVDLRVFCQQVNDFSSSRRPPWGTWCISALR